MSKQVKGRPEVDFVAASFVRSWNLIRSYGIRKLINNLSASNIAAFGQTAANVSKERENIAELIKKFREIRKQQSAGGKAGAQKAKAKKVASKNAATAPVASTPAPTPVGSPV